MEEGDTTEFSGLPRGQDSRVEVGQQLPSSRHPRAPLGCGQR